jgi:hypothetical protein
MTDAPPTVAQIDEALLSTTEAFRRATTRGDILEADAWWNRLDELLDMRLALPLQRPPALPY